jgi:uncharacterized protein DUF4331
MKRNQTTEATDMAHHSTIPHPQTDITDFFIFQNPDNPTNSILILNVNPDAPTKASTFDSEASYEIKIDTNADAVADIAFHILFSSAVGGQQKATVYRASGESAQSNGEVGEAIIRNAPVSFDSEVRITSVGEYRFYAGLRSDPWFADVDGVFNNMQFTGRDTFANANIFGMVIEVPNSALGSNSQLNVWARTIASIDGERGQMDQMGHPLVPAVLTPTEEDRHLFLHTPPPQQRTIFLPKFTAFFQNAGYSQADADRLALQLLPDILPYDYARQAGYPNGRKLTDDNLDLMLALITNGKVTRDLVGPHADLLNEFPYLGSPHPSAS